MSYVNNSKLDDKITLIICEALEIGASRGVAAKGAGIHESTLNTWLKKGEEGLPFYKDFYEQVMVSEAKSELRSLDVIAEAEDNGTWQAAAWKLERKYPDRWGKRERMDVKTDNKLDIHVSTVPTKYEMDDDEKELLSKD